MHSLQDISKQIARNELGEALSSLNDIIRSEPGNAEALFMRGKVYWKLGMRSKAICDYESSAAIDSGGPAVAALEHARDIENFFHPDFFNP